MFLSFFFSWFVIEVLTSQNVGSGVTGVAFHPTKNLVASCSYDKSVKLWNADSGAELWTVTGRTDVVSSVHFSPDGKRLVSGSWDETVMVWDPSTGEQLCQLNVGYAPFSLDDVGAIFNQICDFHKSD